MFLKNNRYTIVTATIVNLLFFSVNLLFPKNNRFIMVTRIAYEYYTCMRKQASIKGSSVDQIRLDQIRLDQITVPTKGSIVDQIRSDQIRLEYLSKAAARAQRVTRKTIDQIRLDQIRLDQIRLDQIRLPINGSVSHATQMQTQYAFFQIKNFIKPMRI